MADFFQESKRLSFTTKSEWTGWQVVLGPLKGAAGVLRENAPWIAERETRGGRGAALPAW